MRGHLRGVALCTCSQCSIPESAVAYSQELFNAVPDTDRAAVAVVCQEVYMGIAEEFDPAKVLAEVKSERDL